MMQKYFYRLKWFMILCYKVFRRRYLHRGTRLNMKYNGKEVMSARQVNDLLYQTVSAPPEDGFCLARFGGVELRGFVKFDPNMGSLRDTKDVLRRMSTNAGFFPATEEAGRRFTEEMRQACGQVDLLCVWHNPMEDYAMKLYAGDIAYGSPIGIEPYYFDAPWSRALKGKKVLVINPFADSIRAQYETKREQLFANPDVLPEFELHTLKAVQTIAGNRDPRFGDWFEALDYMEREAMKIDFDVAIVGCGAYGFPLCARLKKHGKIAIHMGGATQMMFGVKGSRWENNPSFKNIINEHFVRPAAHEMPENAGKVENACYW